MLQSFLNMLQSTVQEWGSRILSNLPKIILALLTVVAFHYMGKLSQLAAERAVKKLKNKALRRFLISLTYAAAVAVGILLALSILQLQKTLTSLLAGLGIAGLGLSFAFKDVLSNFLSGMIIVIRRPFKVGDLVEIGGKTGIIKEITLRSTRIDTPSGQVILMPNAQVLQNPIIDYTHKGERRVEINFGVSYAEKPEKVIKITKEAVKKVKARKKSKEVEVFYTEFGASAANVLVRFWIDFKSSNADHYSAQSDAIKNIKAAFEKHKIYLPFDTISLDFGTKAGVKLKKMMK